MSDLTDEQIAECKDLKLWVNNVSRPDLDSVIEWLEGKNYFNRMGRRFAHRFWLYTWHKSKEPQEAR